MNSLEPHLDLVRRHVEGTATADETRALEAALRTDAALRRQFLRYTSMDAALGSGRLGAAPAARTAPFTSRPARNSWFQWRPLTAAAAGLVLGMLCTSVVWAYAVPHMLNGANHELAISNAGFEESISPLSEGVPVRHAIWSGDFAEIAEAKHDITPREGGRMLRFLRSDSSVSSAPERNVNGNLYQVVDLRPYQNEITSGQATVNWSAWFNWVPGPGEQGMKFRTTVWAFAGDTSILPSNWKDHLYQETAKSSHTIVSNDAPKTWRQIAGSMIVPPDTDFLVVELKAIPDVPETRMEPYRFHGCFADDVRLMLRTHVPQPLAAQNHAPN